MIFYIKFYHVADPEPEEAASYLVKPESKQQCDAPPARAPIAPAPNLMYSISKLRKMSQTATISFYPIIL
jgi:hypothetical protein